MERNLSYTLRTTSTYHERKEPKKMTPEKIQEVKDRFKREGKTVAEFARQHGFQPFKVHSVLNGQLKGNYGKSHEIAKALGLK
jgi:gp16 family phage-associated protein